MTTPTRLLRPFAPQRQRQAASEPASVEQVDPCDGACGVLSDAAVVVRLSRPADPSSLGEDSFRVEDPWGTVPGSARLSPDGRVVVWTGKRPFGGGHPHLVVVSGLRDEWGDPVTPHLSRFIPCGISIGDLAREES